MNLYFFVERLILCFHITMTFAYQYTNGVPKGAAAQII